MIIFLRIGIGEKIILNTNFSHEERCSVLILMELCHFQGLLPMI